MKVVYTNEKKHKKYIAILESCCLFQTAAKQQGLIEEVELHVSFLSRCAMKKINNKFRGKNKATDVLSFPNLLPAGAAKTLLDISKVNKKNFPHDIVPESGNIYLGELLFCMPVIKRQAKQYGQTYNKELCFMAVHGFLHLLGYDHDTEKEGTVMRAVEQSVLQNILTV